MSLTSIGEDAPSGENLEYDQVFASLMAVARVTGERQAGARILPSQEPDPREVVARAEAVLERSHDLRAAVLFGYGQLRVGGFPAFATATGYLRQCLQDFWATCHPQLEDNDDPTMRCNAVLGLCDPAMVLRVARLAPLTASPSFGRMSLRDLAIADGEIEAPAGLERVPDAATVAAAFRDTPPAELSAILAGARAALHDVEGISAIFDVRTPGRGPDLDPLLRLLRRAVARLADEVGEPAEAPAEPDAGGAGEDGPKETVVGARVAMASAGEIGSPRDVEQALDRILTYYTKFEPSSPVPIFLIRAKSLIGADFMTILSEIAPGGIENVKSIGGIK